MSSDRDVSHQGVPVQNSDAKHPTTAIGVGTTGRIKAELGTPSRQVRTGRARLRARHATKFISAKMVTHEKLGHLLLADGDDGRRAQGRARLRAHYHDN